MDVAAFAQSLREQGFRGVVEHDAAVPVVYGTDNSVYQLRPAGVVVPIDTDDLATVARTNHVLGRPFDLVARGGGTGTNGQSLTNGLVVDTRRAMNRIVSIDAERRIAVVEPGVVLGQLNAALKPHGLFFAPHVSTGARATVGGMVSTDAAGKGSLVYGRTNDHVIGAEAVLDDGTRFHAGPLDADELDERIGLGGRLGELHESVRGALDGLNPNAFPDVPRGFTGYNLADAAEGDGVDMAKLLAGSEGTLALLGEITIRLEPLLTDPHLAVVAYPRFDDAVRDANRLKVSGPIAIECLDERTLSLATASPAFPRLAALLGDRFDVTGESSASLLLMEFDGPTGADRLADVLHDVAGAVAMAVTSDPDDIAAAWKVRADAVGLLGRAVDGHRSVAFVEDCAVPPDRLEEFVGEFRAALDRRGVRYGMFGHADVGCLHVRPALDLYDPAHEALLRTISDEVHALVASFGGVLWGEHGRGFRGEYLDLDDDTVHRMRRIKTAFDPHDVLNPGKLYRPLDRGTPVVRIDEVPLRVHRDRSVDEAQRDDFHSAFGCNGNGICHHWGEVEVMCPSFKVTGDPRLSPKGRADLVRAWTADPTDAALADAVADSMRQCLSCGACTGRCPVQVDVPELKSRFFDAYPDNDRRRRLRRAVLSRFESMLPSAQRVARLLGVAQRIAAPVLRSALGVVDLPNVSSDRTRASGQTELADATVVILPDVFTAFIDTEVLDATLRVMRAMGERPAIAPFVPSGKLDHVTGRRKRFAAATERRRTQIEQLAQLGVPLVVIEPAVSLLDGHEYSEIDTAFPTGAATSLAEFLAARTDGLPRAVRQGTTAQLFGHCTEISLAPERTAAYRTLLEAAGCEVVIESTTCCGMAGIFGHEVENQEMSSRLFDSGWRPRLESGDHSHRCASGFSCRSQAERFGHELVHPIQVLAGVLDGASGAI